jgi:large subunit ribosomal protein L1
MAEEKLQTTEELEIVDTTEGAAKAGKRSAKSIKEAEEKAVKEARKEAGDTSPVDPEAEAAQKRGPVPVPRPLIERRGKAYRKAAEKVDSQKAYSLKEAVALAAETSTTKFDGSVELHIKLGVDPRHADQNIRATVTLPNGTGKSVRVAVFAPAAQHEAAKKAGADIVAEDEFLQKLDKEELDFDILIATPQLMAKLGKYARLLGPKGLMPNPKSGTVTPNLADAVKEAKTGKVEFRVDKQAIVHQAVGKVSFGGDKLYENAKAVVDAILAAKPTSVKGAYLQGITVASTMGPGVKADTNSL